MLHYLIGYEKVLSTALTLASLILVHLFSTITNAIYGIAGQWRNFKLGLGGLNKKKIFVNFFLYQKPCVSGSAEGGYGTISNTKTWVYLMAHILRARNLGFRSYVTTDHSLNPG